MTRHRNPPHHPRTRGALMLAIAIAVFGLGACASNPYGWSGQARERVTGEMDAARNAPSVPADVSQGLLSPLEVRLPNGQMDPLEARFDLSVNNASVRQVLMNLVEGTPYSMVVHPDVSGNVSLQLKEVTVPEAMRALRQVYGYYYRREDNRFYVLGRGMQTRVFVCPAWARLGGASPLENLVAGTPSEPQGGTPRGCC